MGERVTHSLVKALRAVPDFASFDVVTDVRIEDDRVEYLDLLLDVRVMRDGTIRMEDEEEVEEAARSGLLSPEHLAIVERTRRELLRDHARIVDEALRLLNPR